MSMQRSAGQRQTSSGGHLNQTAPPIPNALRRFFDGGPPILTAPARGNRTMGASGVPPLSSKGALKRTYHPIGPPEIDDESLATFAPSHLLPKAMQRVIDIQNGRPVGSELEDALPVEKGKVVQLEPDKYEFFAVRKQGVEVVDPIDGGYFEQPALVPSRQRQEALFVEAKKRYAEKEIRKQVHKDMRLGALMQKRHPFGVLGVENPGNSGTIVYAAQHQEWQEEARRHNTRLAKMREAHMSRSRSYDILQAGGKGMPPVDAATVTSEMFQTRRKNVVHHDNHARLFGGKRAEGKDRATEPWVFRHPRPGRAQHLRNMETNGRKLDIITGAVLQETPPTIGEKVVHRKLHYSMNPPPNPPHVKE